ncbi:hypothetical protein D3C73_1161410 [compost metagenome]
MMFTICEGDFAIVIGFIQQNQRIATICILKSTIDQSLGCISRCSNPYRSGLDNRRQMSYDIVMGVARNIFIIRLVNINRAITGLAATFPIRPFIGIQHQVPNNNTFAPVIDCSQCYLAHVLHQAFVKITSIIPFSDGGLGKDQFFVRTLVMNIH